MVKRKRLKNDLGFKIFCYILLFLLALFFTIPFQYMFFGSFKSITEILKPNAPLIPSEWHFENYIKAIDADFLRYFKNTMIVITVNVIGGPLITYFVAYTFARLDFVGKNPLFGFLMALCMIPSTLTQVPLYVLFSKVGFLDNLLSLTVPCLLGGNVLNMFLFRQYIMSIPRSLDESAKIDGANHFVIIFRILLPMCKPIVIFIMAQIFNGQWSDFIGPLTYISDERYFTMAVGIYQRFKGATNPVTMQPNVQMALGVLIMIVPLTFFGVFQKEIIEGVSMTGLKE